MSGVRNVEFPPVYACNACGSYETEWYEISGKRQNCIRLYYLRHFLQNRNIKRWVSLLMEEVELEEGTRLNAVVRGISKKNRAELTEKLPLNIQCPSIIGVMANFKTVVFDLDEEQ